MDLEQPLEVERLDGCKQAVPDHREEERRNDQLREAGDATVTIRSLDPELLVFDGPSEQTLNVSAGGSIEARFAAAAKAVGRARVQMTVKLANETDSFEDVVPVEVLASPETVAAYGQLGGETARADESLTIPQNVVPGFGGLHVEMSSTAMVGLSEGARYLVEYPYGCAEQKGSRALAMVLASDLGDAFSLPGVDTARMRPAVQKTLKELELFQCPNGGFTYWPGTRVSRRGCPGPSGPKGIDQTCPPSTSFQVTNASERPSAEKAGAYSKSARPVSRRGVPAGRSIT